MEEIKEIEENNVPEEEEVTYKEMSPLRLVSRRFFRSKLSIVGLVMLAFVLLFSFFGPVVYSKWGEEGVDRTEGLNTFVYTYVITDADGNEITVTEIREQKTTINTYAPPSGDHLLGTDEKGYDIFSRLMYGGRISLLIGFIVVILETLIGILFGGLAGYYGGWVDNVIMRIVDIFNCIPTTPMLMIVGVAFQLYSDPSHTFDCLGGNRFVEYDRRPANLRFNGNHNHIRLERHGKTCPRADTVTEGAGVYHRCRGHGSADVAKDFQAFNPQRNAPAHSFYDLGLRQRNFVRIDAQLSGSRRPASESGVGFDDSNRKRPADFELPRKYVASRRYYDSYRNTRI